MQERFETFTVLINRISRDIRRIKNQEMAAYHLRSAHVSCLYYIYSLDGVTAAELCEHCEEDKATISRALEHLESNGFIVRNSERAKRYRSPLRLTEKGQEAGKRIAEKISAVLDNKHVVSVSCMVLLYTVNIYQSPYHPALYIPLLYG